MYILATDYLWQSQQMLILWCKGEFLSSQYVFINFPVPNHIIILIFITDVLKKNCFKPRILVQIANGICMCVGKIPNSYFVIKIKVTNVSVEDLVIK